VRPDPETSAAATLRAAGIVVLDSELAGTQDHNGVFLLPGSEPVLVESGTGLAAPRVAAALSALGIGPRDLAGIVVTHVHLDHAGGAGELARRYPNARVFAHPAGVRHLVDPTRLVSSARQVYGAALDTVYGGMTPIDATRVHALADGEIVTVGGRRLVAAHTPGHAPHHVAVLDTVSGSLFTGDAAGVRIPGMLAARPSTPPPSFDAGAAHASLRRMADLAPDRLVLTHFGAVSAAGEYLADLGDRLDRWCAAARASVAAGRDAAALEADLLRLFAAEEGLPVTDPARFAATGGYGPNAAGLHSWAIRNPV
jgi:glyoxylase-like metal-dependent hydrolase (beta-lactamase superfamily II)